MNATEKKKMAHAEFVAALEHLEHVALEAIKLRAGDVPAESDDMANLQITWNEAGLRLNKAVNEHNKAYGVHLRPTSRPS